MNFGYDLVWVNIVKIHVKSKKKSIYFRKVCETQNYFLGKHSYTDWIKRTKCKQIPRNANFSNSRNDSLRLTMLRHASLAVLANHNRNICCRILQRQSRFFQSIKKILCLGKLTDNWQTKRLLIPKLKTFNFPRVEMKIQIYSEKLQCFS